VPPVDELADGAGVPGEAAVVLDAAVLDGGVEVHAHEDRLPVVEVVERRVAH